MDVVLVYHSLRAWLGSHAYGRTTTTCAHMPHACICFAFIFYAFCIFGVGSFLDRAGTRHCLFLFIWAWTDMNLPCLYLDSRLYLILPTFALHTPPPTHYPLFSPHPHYPHHPHPSPPLTPRIPNFCCHGYFTGCSTDSPMYWFSMCLH